MNERVKALLMRSFKDEGGRKEREESEEETRRALSLPRRFRFASLQVQSLLPSNVGRLGAGANWDGTDMSESWHRLVARLARPCPIYFPTALLIGP